MMKNLLTCENIIILSTTDSPQKTRPVQCYQRLLAIVRRYPLIWRWRPLHWSIINTKLTSHLTALTQSMYRLCNTNRWEMTEREVLDQSTLWEILYRFSVDYFSPDTEKYNFWNCWLILIVLHFYVPRRLIK